MQNPSLLSTATGIRAIHWSLLTLILSAALLVRLWDIGHESFWGDEFLSAEVSAGHGYEHRDWPTDRLLPPQRDMLGIAAAGLWSATWDALQRSTHPPIYFLILRLWRELGKFDDDASLRMLSAIFSVGCVAVAFDAVRVLQRSTVAGLWAAAVLAAANVQVQFAQEARGYALLILFMLLACDALARIERFGISRPRLVGLILASVGMLLTHYMAGVICLLLAIYAGVQLRSLARKQVWLSLLVAVMFSLAVWGPSMLVQIETVHDRLGWLVQQPAGQTTLRRLLAWPIGTLVHPGWRPGGECYGAAILFLLPLLMIRKYPSLRLWTLLLFGQLAVVALSDGFGQTAALNFPRYTLPAATAAAILIPLMVLQLPHHRLIRFAPAVVVLACVLGLPLSYEHNKPDYRKMARFIEHDCAGDSVIVFTSIQPNSETSMLAVALSRYADESKRRIVVTDDSANALKIAPTFSAGVVDIVTDALSAQAVIPHSTVIGTGFFPGIGSCTRVRVSGSSEAWASRMP